MGAGRGNYGRRLAQLTAGAHLWPSGASSQPAARSRSLWLARLLTWVLCLRSHTSQPFLSVVQTSSVPKISFLVLWIEYSAPMGSTLPCWSARSLSTSRQERKTTVKFRQRHVICVYVVLRGEAWPTRRGSGSWGVSLANPAVKSCLWVCAVEAVQDLFQLLPRSRKCGCLGAGQGLKMGQGQRAGFCLALFGC